MENGMNMIIIKDTLEIEAKILDSMKKINNLKDFSDVKEYDEEIEKIKLFLKKEKFLISKIPEDIEIYNYIFNYMNTQIIGLKDEDLLKSRFRTILYNKYLQMLPDITPDEEYEEEEPKEGKQDLINRLYIRTNLLVEYLRSFDNPMKIANEKSKQLFNRIRLFNIFINSHLFDMWTNNYFDIECINYYTEKEMQKKLKLSEEDYKEQLEDIVTEDSANLLAKVLTPSKKPKKNIIIQDSFFNFRFLITKLSTEQLKSIIDGLDGISETIDDHPLYSTVINSLTNEIDSRDDKDIEIEQELEEDDEIEEQLPIDKEAFNKIVNLIKFEDKLIDYFMEIDLSSDNNDMKKISQMVNYEKTLVNEIGNSPSIFVILRDLFDDNLWIYLTGNVAEKTTLITQRILNLLPIYNEINVLPYQKINSHNFIQKNHMIRSLKKLWDLSQESENVIGEGLKKVYKYNYFTNPLLTDELISIDGNHRLLFDLSPELSGLSDLEYKYDQDEQLFKTGCSLIMFIMNNEASINSVLDFANFQFKINELMDILLHITPEYQRKLYNFLNANSSFFSPLRHDLRKIFKEAMNKKENKKVKKY